MIILHFSLYLKTFLIRNLIKSRRVFFYEFNKRELFIEFFTVTIFFNNFQNFQAVEPAQKFY
jgi:hypothetical protein